MLTLDGILGPYSIEPQTILERASVLEELHSIPASEFDHHVRLLVRNFHDRSGEMEMFDSLAGSTRDWGCASTLTRLEIVVERMHPTSVDGTTAVVDGQTVPLTIGCTTEHAVVYQQLGRFVNLRQLRLGQRMAPRIVGGREERVRYQANCLLFSMESELDPFSGMRALQTLDFR